jgi:lipopolysaccharide export system protein LptA
MKKILLVLVLSMSLAPVHAERADANKQAAVDADDIQLDDANKVLTGTGNVVVTKGTLKLTSEQGIVRETPEGYAHVTLIAKPGGKATFRQKRDGAGDLWMEGEAQRIEYDERSQVVTLIGKAEVRQLEAGRIAQQMQSEYLSYDGRREYMSNTAPEGKKGPGTRASVILQPKRGRSASGGEAQ